MRIAARKDANQDEIVDALRTIGATVQIIHQLGQGCPDLLCGYRGANYLLEVKDGAKPPSKRILTPDEAVWHEMWRGQVDAVKNVKEALQVIGARAITKPLTPPKGELLKSTPEGDDGGDVSRSGNAASE